MQQKSFENTLNEKVKDFELRPRSGMWQAIEAELEPEKKRFAPLWWALPTAIAIVVLILLLINQPCNSSAHQIVQSNQQLQTLKAPRKGIESIPMASSQISNEQTNSNITQDKSHVHYKAFRRKKSGIDQSPLPTTRTPSAEFKRKREIVEGKPFFGGHIWKPNVILVDTPTLSFEAIMDSIDSIQKDTPIVPTLDIQRKAPQPIWHAFVGLVLQPTQSNSLLTENPNYTVSPSNLGSDYAYRKTTDETIRLFGASAILGWQTKRHQYYTGLGIQQYGFKQNVKNIKFISCIVP